MRASLWLQGGVWKFEDAPPFPANEAVEFFPGIFWLLSRVELAPPSHHLLSGEPYTKIHKLNVPCAVGPPKETNLLDGEKNKATFWLFCLQFQIVSCSHEAPQVWRGQRPGVRFSREGSAVFGTKIPI